MVDTFGFSFESHTSIHLADELNCSCIFLASITVCFCLLTSSSSVAIDFESYFDIPFDRNRFCACERFSSSKFDALFVPIFPNFHFQTDWIYSNGKLNSFEWINYSGWFDRINSNCREPWIAVGDIRHDSHHRQHTENEKWKIYSNDVYELQQQKLPTKHITKWSHSHSHTHTPQSNSF